MSVNNLKKQTEEFTSTGAKTNPSAPRGPILIAGVYAIVTRQEAHDYFKSVDDKDETDVARIEAAKEVFSKEDVDMIGKFCHSNTETSIHLLCL
jgi:hypothetical protein